MTVSAQDFVGSADALKTAGLDQPGQYKFEVVDVKTGENTQYADADWLGRKEGDKYPVIVMTFSFLERAEYDEEGNHIGNEELSGKRTRIEYLDIKSDGDLQKLRTLYKTITGRSPNGTIDRETGEHTINYYDVAVETRGGQAWNTIYHTKAEDSKKGEIYAKMGRKFDSKPWGKIRVKESE